MQESRQSLGRRWKLIDWAISVLMAGMLVALVTSFLVGDPPVDYVLFMNGADSLCFDSAQFAYGPEAEIWYPAPFYSTFCLPYHYLEPVLRLLWMVAPLAMAVWLARGRVALLTYAPLSYVVLLGQSSWLGLPAYTVVQRAEAQQPVSFKHGLFLALGVFKPHIALPAWIWMAVRRRWNRSFVVGWLGGTLALVLPAFLIRPSWLGEWLEASMIGRSGVTRLSLTGVALLTDRLGWATGSTFALCAAVGLIVFLLIRQTRGRLSFYDWSLLYFLTVPFVRSHDLLVLLPFVAATRKRAAVAVVAGIVAWLFAINAGRFTLVAVIPMALLALRLMRPDD